jgi:prevent-host-death family protein
MARTIAQRELRNDNAKIIEAVLAGEHFVVTRNGEPVAELRPVRHTRRTFVPRADLIFARQDVRLDSAGLRRDLDDVVDQSL